MRRDDPQYPVPSRESISAVMRANRKRDTGPEVRLRSELHRTGLRFRKHYLIRCPELSVRADIAFPGLRLAVFVDGCFWHRCPIHGNSPRVNQRYWKPKLDGNVERDRRVDSALEAEGWRVLRVWEHVPLHEAARLVQRAVEKSRLHGAVV